jgi:hypothetical protein
MNETKHYGEIGGEEGARHLGQMAAASRGGTGFGMPVLSAHDASFAPPWATPTPTPGDP